MVVCGDDGLAHRLAAELRGVHGEQVTLVVPPNERSARPPVVGRARAASAALLDRVVSAAVGLGGGNGGNGGNGTTASAGSAHRADGERVLEAVELTEAVLAEAGVERAAALALVHDDDEINIRAALTARRLNPRLRLVLRLYNRRLGQHIEELLDQTAALAAGVGADEAAEASTTVLSDADTAAPALAAAAVAGTTKVVQTDSLLLRAVERVPSGTGGSPIRGCAPWRCSRRPARILPGRTGPTAPGSRNPCCCRTTRRYGGLPGGPRWCWSRCPPSVGPRRPRPGAGWGSYRRSPPSSHGGCGGRWPGSWGVWSRSPSRCRWSPGSIR